MPCRQPDLGTRRQASGSALAARFELLPGNDLTPDGEWWVATGPDPYFIIRPPGRRPAGWGVVRFDAQTDGEALTPVLYVDDGSGFSQANIRYIPPSDARAKGVLI